MIKLIAFMVVMFGVFVCKVIEEERKENKKITIIEKIQLMKLIKEKEKR